MSAVPLRFASVPLAGFVPIDLAEADALLIAWGHYLEECDRPFRNEAWALDVLGEPLSIAITSSIVSTTVCGYRRNKVVELSRLATKPGERWATRVALRLWREIAAPRYLPWVPCAAVAYSKNDRHDGRTYRFDGWTKVTDKAGSGGGGTLSASPETRFFDHGHKTLWLWEYA